MTDWRRTRLIVTSVLLAAIPVLFGLIRAISTGSDVRYLWLSGASLIGSAAVMAVRRGTGEAMRVSVALALGGIIAGSASAAAAAMLLGAKAGPGVAIVAVGFGLCTGTSAVLARLARTARPT